MNNQNRHALGKCPCCGIDVAKAKSYFTSGMLDGQMRSIKCWNDNAYKGVFITSLGTQVHLTMCKKCIDNIKPDTLRHLWDYALEGMAQENTAEYRKAVGASELNRDQVAFQAAEILKLRSHTLVGLYTKIKV
jgi:hypothetical protein